MLLEAVEPSAHEADVVCVCGGGDAAAARAVPAEVGVRPAGRRKVEPVVLGKARVSGVDGGDARVTVEPMKEHDERQGLRGVAGGHPQVQCAVGAGKLEREQVLAGGQRV